MFAKPFGGLRVQAFPEYLKMEIYKTDIERIYELARTGWCLTVKDIRRRLLEGQYSTAQLECCAIKKELRELPRKRPAS